MDIGEIKARITADVSGLKSAAGEGKESVDAVIASLKAMAEQAGVSGKDLDVLEQNWRAAAQAANQWTEADQQAAMSMSRTHDEALKMNQALNDAKSGGEQFAQSLLGMVGLGAAAAGGFALMEKGLEALKEVTIGSIEVLADLNDVLIVSQQIGASVASADAWDRGAEIFGAGAQKIASSFAMLDQKIAEGSKNALKALEDLHLGQGQLLDASPEEKMQLLAKAFQEAAERGEHLDVIARELFGKSGLGMLSVLSDDAQNFYSKIKDNDSELERQAELARKWKEETALLADAWERVKRAIGEPIVKEILDPSVWMRAATLGLIGNGLNGGISDGRVVQNPLDRAAPSISAMDTSSALATLSKGLDEELRKATEQADKADAKYAERAAKLEMEMEAISRKAEETQMTKLNESMDKAEEQMNAIARKAEEAAMKSSKLVGEGDFINVGDMSPAILKNNMEVAKLEAQHLTREYKEQLELVRQIASTYSEVGSTIGALADLLNTLGAGGGVVNALAGAGQAMEKGAHAAQDGLLSWSELAGGIKDAFSAGAQGGAGAGLLSGGAEGASMGAMFGPMGAAIGGAAGALTGLLGGLFGKPEYKKVMEDVGKEWGVSISEGLAKAIEATEKSDNVSRQMAELLNLDQIMKEAGGDPAQFASKINNLMEAVKLGAVPAKEGLDELGKAFTDLKTAADGGSVASEAAMIQMIKRAKELGEVIPGMDAAIKAALQDAVSGLKDFFGGQSQTGPRGKGGVSPEQAAANQEILGATFEALAAQDGLVSAAEQLKDSFEAMQKTLPKGTELTGSAADLARMMKLLENEEFSGAAKSAAGGAKVLRGLEDSGNLSQATLDAFGKSAQTLQEQARSGAKAAGATDEEANKAALEAILPLLKELSTAKALGGKLTPEEEKMLADANKAGILPLQDVGVQQLQTQQQIRDGINRLNGIAGGGTGESGGGVSPGPAGSANNPVRAAEGFFTDRALGIGPLPDGGTAFIAHPGEDVFIGNQKQVLEALLAAAGGKSPEDFAKLFGSGGNDLYASMAKASSGQNFSTLGTAGNPIKSADGFASLSMPKTSQVAAPGAKFTSSPQINFSGTVIGSPDELFKMILDGVSQGNAQLLGAIQQASWRG